MRRSKDSTIRVDGQVLTFAGKVFPLRNIAYLEKSEVKRKKGFRIILLVTALVLISVGLASASNTDYLDVEPYVFGTMFLGAI